MNLDDAPMRIREDLSAHAGRKVLDEALTYLDNHGHQMDYAAGGLEGDAGAADLAADILGLLGALHHLVRRYHDIIDATGERHR